ncbi:MAG: GNAT family protein [Saprospiraceae bacterium]
MLNTNRLILQLPSDALIEEYLNFLTRNREFFQKWGPAHSENYFTLETQKKRLGDNLKRIEEGVDIRFLISLQNEPSRIISEITLTNIVRFGFQSGYLGYQTDKDIQSKGYTTEALKTTIDYLFSEIKLHRIEANVMPGNAPSIRLLQKLNFEHQGTFKKYLKINGEWEDHLCFVLLNPSP